MSGLTIKHKVFSAISFLAAAAVLVNLAYNIYQQAGITFDTAYGVAVVMFMLSMALIPEFFFRPLSQTLNLTLTGRRASLSKWLQCGALLLVALSVIAEQLLQG